MYTFLSSFLPFIFERECLFYVGSVSLMQSNNFRFFLACFDVSFFSVRSLFIHIVSSAARNKIFAARFQFSVVNWNVWLWIRLPGAMNDFLRTINPIDAQIFIRYTYLMGDSLSIESAFVFVQSKVGVSQMFARFALYAFVRIDQWAKKREKQPNKFLTRK